MIPESVAKPTKKVAKHHPNASLATSVGTLGVLLAWVFGIVGVTLSAPAGAALATVLVSTSLFIGKRGLKGVLCGIWEGFGHEEDEE